MNLQFMFYISISKNSPGHREKNLKKREIFEIRRLRWTPFIQLGLRFPSNENVREKTENFFRVSIENFAIKKNKFRFFSKFFGEIYFREP